MSFDAVVFDLGRVLVGLDLGWPRHLDLPAYPDGPVRAWFDASPEFRALERGEISEERFLAAFAMHFDRPDLDAIEEAFAACVTGPLPGAVDLVDSIQVRCAALSNTNRIHWRVFDPDRALRSRLVPLASHVIGARKPEPAAYARTAAILGTDRILFLDDNAANVEAARRAGWVAEQVVGVEAAAAALRAHGVL